MKKYDHIKDELIRLHNQGVRPTEIYRTLGIPKSSFLHLRQDLNLESRSIRSTSVEINPILMEYLVGMIMGDAHLMKATSYSSAISFAHAERYKEYFDYKVNLLLSFGGSIQKQNYFDIRTSKYYPRYCYSSHSIKELKVLREKFYPEGKKVIPMDIIEKYFSNLSMAILFMDDGCSQKYTTIISTQCFERSNLSEFLKFLERKFGIEFTIQKKGTIRLLQKDSQKLYGIVKEEIEKVLCMQYKLKYMSSENSVKRGNSTKRDNPVLNQCENIVNA